jgi:predicted peroxiredoxin
MEIKFETLTKKKAKLYINLFGKSGCGKTYTALTIATNLASKNQKVLIIDTEDRAHYYANDFVGVNVFNAKNIKVSDLLFVIQKAHQELGIEAVVIDSLTPFWDAMIEFADNQKITAHGANWKIPKKTINTMTLAFRRCGLHVITTSLGKDKVDNAMNPTGKILPCFERLKFEPYLDIQVILNKNGKILETPKQLHHDLKDIFNQGVQVNKEWCDKIKAWLGNGQDINASNDMHKFISEARSIEDEDGVKTSKIQDVDVDVDNIEIPEIDEDKIVKKIEDENKKNIHSLV